MNSELVKKFYDRWPKWFNGLTLTPYESCLAFGFECGEGWFDILWRLCEDIEKLNPPKDFEVHQIKEKFGGLRFYTGAGTDEIFDRIEQAEQESYKTCEACGSTKNVTSEGRWITTLCKECRKPKGH
jgi:hypothetical protein